MFGGTVGAYGGFAGLLNQSQSREGIAKLSVCL